jgi:hypothetical protein
MVLLGSTKQGEYGMQLELDGVASDEHSLTGITIKGEKFRASGRLALPHFNGTVTEGPEHLLSFPCTAVIDDMCARLTITPKIFKYTGAEVFG